MALKEITVDGEVILVEVTDLPVEGGAVRGSGGRFEYTAAGGDMGKYISGLVQAMTKPVQRAIDGAGASEWTLELNLGFKGETGLPFIAKGEAEGAVKVTAKWNKDT